MKMMGGAIALLLSFLPVRAAVSAPNSELRRLEKCYAVFVRERILKTDPLWVKVANGTQTGTDACMEIFDRAKLGTDGNISKVNGVFDPIGSKVLSSFLEFYRGQFTVTEYFARYSNSNMVTPDIIDSNEPAYHYLYSLFKPSENFSNVVLRDYSIQAERFSAFNRRTTRVTNLVTPLNFLQENATVVQQDDGTQLQTDAALPWAVTPVKTGQLVGLVPDVRQNILTNPPTQDAFALGRNANETFGGGVLGTQSYFAANNNKSGRVTGGANSYRLWGKSVIQDFLCRSLPSLRSSDVVSFVNPNSSLSFQKAISCQRCHRSMDALAGAGRKLMAVQAMRLNGVGQGARFFSTVSGADTMASATITPAGEDTNYSRRPAEGILAYRGYDGELHNHSVVGIAGVGQSIAQSNDLYVCAAKRMYQHLTGRIGLFPDPDPLYPSNFTLGEQNVRNKIINLGMQLKQDQSMRNMVRSIVASPEFVTDLAN